jgi:hypothetical protein
MATTETRTGFRLPWAADRAPSREVDEMDGPAEAGDEARGFQPDDPAASAAADDPAAGAAERSPAEPAVPTSEREARPTDAPVAVPAPARRPTKFMADLMKAMHSAAEGARSASLEQFRSDGQAFVEQIHARSATQAADLRRRTDDDVAEIKEWSKAEIARIREATEQRITARRQQLDGQLERHAALVEREVEKVRDRVTAYEAEMQTFFDKILAEEDPTFFAALAAQMPEPPTFEEIDEEALAELLREPEPEPAVEPAVEAAAEPVETPEPAVAVEQTAGPVETTAETAVASTTELETAMAAIQVAAEEADGEAAAEAPETAATTAEPEPVEPAVEPENETEAAVDPRIAMLGLTPDFAAAEAEAAASAAAYAGEGFDEMGEETVSARLAGLVMPAGSEAPAPVATATSQVVVVGLVSVASIASFKRHLGRLAGVTHVGVSSGPDGEFVYTVTHDQAMSLAELVPTIPGFGARVTGTGDGIVHVSAGDPEA